MTPAQRILSLGSATFNELILLSRKYGTEPTRPNYYAHAKEVVDNLLEEAGEFLEQSEKQPCSPDYYKEKADFVFVANTISDLGYFIYPHYGSKSSNQQMFFKNRNSSHKYDILPQPIPQKIAELYEKFGTLAIPYPYALAVTLSNLSKFFPCNEDNINKALHHIETKRNDWQLFQTKNANGQPFLFFSKDGKVRKEDEHIGFSYTSKEEILDIIWGNLSIYYNGLLRPDEAAVMQENFAKCTNEVEVINQICVEMFPTLTERAQLVERLPLLAIC